MKFTGFAVSLALAGVVSAGVIPAASNIDGTVAGTEGAAVGAVAPVTDSTGHIVDDATHSVRGLGGAIKRDAGNEVGAATQALPGAVNGATGIAGSAVGTTESTVSGAAGTVEGTVAGLGSHKRDDLGGAVSGAGNTVDSTVGSTVGSTVPAAVSGMFNFAGEIRGEDD
ncbi:hypothetical protein NUU61_001166 [Penicillium alfredii]|uniref:Uncharacterized protein n=1 Tax=Penicillium alfredii TaxID=1506179 RepID=A0A9W9GBC5_9EURO|nr:uncharacterized protein NUU61_001166 [Penicillium alfredii]KAJ5115407.1 hypothetical protein NUU61_001166 [Penicillium alfredii]